MPRKAGFQHFQKTREKIQAAQIINRLVSIGMGEVDATSQQVNALKTLLNKVLPDLQSVESVVDAEINGRLEGIKHVLVDPRDTEGVSGS